MQTELLHIGFGGMVAANRVLAIISPNSAPVRRLIRRAKQSGTSIDMTYGRKTKAVLVLDSGHIALAPIQPETIASRLRSQRQRGGPAPEEEE